jgi:ADP-ribose pyrophosphatase YjhB (NUDIX family)
MLGIEHQVRVFVFDVLSTGIRYLLLRQKPTVEWPFAPVIGTVQPHEHMQDAVIRGVLEETGVQRPVHMMDLAAPQKDLFGEVGLVSWPFAYQAGGPSSPAVEIHPGPTVGEFTWVNFAEAFELVDGDRDREALVRLQLTLES